MSEFSDMLAAHRGEDVQDENYEVECPLCVAARLTLEKLCEAHTLTEAIIRREKFEEERQNQMVAAINRRTTTVIDGKVREV